MKTFHEYWSFTAMRGVFALFAAIAIIAIPRAVSSLFALPILIGFAIGLFALYTFFEMAATSLLAQLLPNAVLGRRAYYPQIAIAAIITILLFLTGYQVLSLGWLLWLAAVQAATSAAAEFLIARSTHREYKCLSCYSTAIVLAVSAVALPLASGLSTTGMAFALATYLGIFGVSESTLGGRMLLLEYRSEHPTHQLVDDSWRALMTVQPPLTLASAAAECTPCLTCETCPADAVCRDNSAGAQIAALRSTRQPSIINSIRAAALIQSHP